MDIFELIDDEIIEEDYTVLNYINPDRRQRPDHMSAWDDDKFHRRFRLEKSTVGYKISNTTNRNKSVPPLQQILLTLRFYACGSFYITIGGNTAEDYRNRKGFFSLNVQAMCTSDLIFQDIVTRWPGSTLDSQF